jgi:hypothetical protein
MPRTRKPRTWVKIDCNGILRGSINWILTLEEQAVWVKMIAYAEVCGGPPGYIQDNDGNGVPKEFLAQELHCPVNILESTIEKMKKENSIEVTDTGIIFLIHFDEYQFTEYDRQKPYRDAKKHSDDPDKFVKGKYGGMVDR